jgi:hypothetical protein
LVLGQKSPVRFDEEVSNEDSDRGSYTPDFSARKESVAPPVKSASEDEDDALSYFQKLADE